MKHKEAEMLPNQNLIMDEHKHTDAVTYLSALHSGTLSVGVTDGQCVSVRRTRMDATEKKKQKTKTKSYGVNVRG